MALCCDVMWSCRWFINISEERVLKTDSTTSPSRILTSTRISNFRPVHEQPLPWCLCVLAMAHSSPPYLAHSTVKFTLNFLYLQLSPFSLHIRNFDFYKHSNPPFKYLSHFLTCPDPTINGTTLNNTPFPTSSSLKIRNCR